MNSSKRNLHLELLPRRAAMPAPSTLRVQNLRKLDTSSSEAREMLKLMNDMPKLKGNQKIFYSTGSSGERGNSSDSSNTKAKANTKGWIGKIFNINNLLKAIIIFLIGYSIRYFISTDVFSDINSITSIGYYSIMSYVAVIVGNCVNEQNEINLTKLLSGVKRILSSLFDKDKNYMGVRVDDSETSGIHRADRAGRPDVAKDKEKSVTWESGQAVAGSSKGESSNEASSLGRTLTEVRLQNAQNKLEGIRSKWVKVDGVLNNKTLNSNEKASMCDTITSAESNSNDESRSVVASYAYDNRYIQEVLNSGMSEDVKVNAINSYLDGKKASNREPAFSSRSDGHLTNLALDTNVGRNRSLTQTENPDPVSQFETPPAPVNIARNNREHNIPELTATPITPSSTYNPNYNANPDAQPNTNTSASVNTDADIRRSNRRSFVDRLLGKRKYSTKVLNSNKSNLHRVGLDQASYSRGIKVGKKFYSSLSNPSNDDRVVATNSKSGLSRHAALETNFGINNTYSIKVSRRRYSKANTAVENRWWYKPSKAMPAPSTIRVQNLRKLSTTSVEARQMLSLINTMGKLKANPNNFYSSSPSGRGKNSKIWIDYNLFVNNDFENFKKELFYSGKLKAGELYSVLFKIRKGDIYLMMGKKQEKVMFNSINDESFVELFEGILDRFEEMFAEYPKELGYTCDTLLLEFWPVNVKDDIKITNLKEAK
jgi:hypothetical protein